MTILSDCIAKVNAQFGAGTIFDVTQKGILQFPFISSGSFIIDWITGIGGFPQSRITELHGEHMCGKTTSALHAAVECQNHNMGVLYLDYEHAISLPYFVSLGGKITPDYFALYQPNDLESGLRVAEFMMENGAAGLIIVDSVAAMMPSAEGDSEIGETQLGLQARVLSTSLRQLKGKINKSKTAWVFINQLRSVIDTSWAGQQRARFAGPQKDTPGGKALKFYADLRLEYIPLGTEKIEISDAITGQKAKRIVSQRVKVTAVKNKCAAPFRSGEILIRSSGGGIDSTVPCLQLALKYELIRESTKGHYVIGTPYCDSDVAEKAINGFDGLYDYFEARPDQLKCLFNEVWKSFSQEN